jgi:hypothetical protein
MENYINKVKYIFISVVFSVVFSVVANAQEPDPNWDNVAKAIWPTFKSTPHMIDSCALKIAHGIEIDRYSGWPAYCNNYEKTSVVVDRVTELRKIISSMDISSTQLEKLVQGKVWIGATDKHVMLSWGRPEDVNRTITANKVNEQWVYSGGYIYIKNGIVTAIQN